MQKNGFRLKWRELFLHWSIGFIFFLYCEMSYGESHNTEKK